MRLLVPAAAAALLLALTGCSEPEPGSPMPTGAAPATSAQPTSAQPSAAPSTAGTTTGPSATGAATETSTPAPTLPPEATTNDAAGAEAFVRHWFETLTYALAAGDTQALSDISHPSCSLCATYINEIDQRTDAGASISGGAFEIQEAVAPASDGTGSTFVAVVYNRAEGTVVDKDGGVLEAIPAERGSVDAVLTQEGESWVLYGFGN